MRQENGLIVINHSLGDNQGLRDNQGLINFISIYGIIRC